MPSLSPGQPPPIRKTAVARCSPRGTAPHAHQMSTIHKDRPRAHAGKTPPAGHLGHEISLGIPLKSEAKPRSIPLRYPVEDALVG